MIRIARLASLGSLALALLAPNVALAALAGPAFPAPGGTTFTSSGSSSGDAGGKTFNYSAIQVGTFSRLYWGAGAPTTVALTPSSPTTLIFDPSTSSLASGIARFVASGVPYDNPNPGAADGPLRVRFTITQTAPAGSAFILAPVEIPSTGAVVNVLSAGPAFSVNLLFEAEYPPNSGVFVPVNQLPQLSAGTTHTDFSGGFYSAAVVAPAGGLSSTWALALGLSGLGLWLLKRRSQLRIARPAL